MLDSDELPTPPTVKRRWTGKQIGSVLEVVGGLFVSAAAFGASMFAGLLTAGGLLIVYGVATELGGS